MPVRRAGRARVGDREVTWTVAEGARGRRWREVVTADGAIAHSLLLETSPDGRFAHLELSTAAGLLTLHPEADGTLHGNAVGIDGVAHVRGLPWPHGSVMLVEGSIVAAAAAAGAATGAGAVRATLVRRDLSIVEEAVDALSLSGPLDADGLPELEGGTSWSLEAD
jgi:hypothetical protein